MAVQAALIAETIVAMKRALQDRYETPGSHDLVLHPTNRGQKLKRKAEFLHEGQLSDVRVYKRKVEYAGYQRYISSQNPKRYDEYGDELEDDEVDDKADAEAAEENPNSEIKLEELLMPLTSAAELPNHPSLSTPYKSTILADMVQQTCEMIHKERRTLWNIKNLLIKFRGDTTWIAGNCIVSPDDAALFELPKVYHDAVAPLHRRQVNGQTVNKEQILHIGAYNAGEKSMSNHQDAMLAHHDEQRTMATNIIKNAEVSPPKACDSTTLRTTTMDTASYISDPAEGCLQIMADGRSHRMELENGGISRTGDNPSSNVTFIALRKPNLTDESTNTSASDARDVTNIQADSIDEENTEMTEAPTAEEVAVATAAQEHTTEEAQAPLRRMTTRAQAQAASDKTLSSHTRTPSREPSEPPLVHLLYTVPPTAVPNRDFGLPAVEAEETRRILMMWVQKQEEVCRSVEKLYGGLLKANRMQKSVYKWCKAEGHVGEMSDGEDWYDKEEWALEEDLKKGQLEEEDDTANQGKKTRGRRVAQ